MNTVKTKPITWIELAKRLGFSRSAIYLWREMPDAPTEPDLVQWQAFIEQHGLGKNSTKSLTELKGEVEAEKLRKLRREN
jgi:predicted DNA-binding transcriptional regulator AlpA